MDKNPRVWSLQDAKAKLSEVIDRVEEGEEQIITRHGKQVAKVVPLKQSENTGKNFVEFMRKSPLRGVKLSAPKRVGNIAVKPKKADLW